MSLTVPSLETAREQAETRAQQQVVRNTIVPQSGAGTQTRPCQIVKVSKLSNVDARDGEVPAEGIAEITTSVSIIMQGVGGTSIK